jgi:hypothetical protein
MTQKQPPESPKGKTGESDSAPMERFRALTRRLLKVSSRQIKDEQDRYEKETRIKRG